MYNGAPSKKRRRKNGAEGPASNGEQTARTITREKALELGLPNRWTYCPPMGKVVAERFLPMKTPLSTLYDELLEPKLRFHPQDVFRCRLNGAKEGAKIGMWIDLTKTTRYYNKDEVECHGCVYKKMPMEGHNQAPTKEETSRFIEEVRNFVDEHPDDVIAVHCTHGFNRTGFLVIYYLVEEYGYALEMAVEEFKKCRHDGIYKQDYLDELVGRLEEDQQIEAPPRPEWESGPDPSINYERLLDIPSSAESSGSNTSSTHTGSEEANGIAPETSGPQFMDGKVPAVTLVTDSAMTEYLQTTIKEMCKTKKKGFPGSQPVSLERSPENNNLDLLVREEYMVSWKADGMRYLVLIKDKGQVYAFDRDNNVFEIPNLHFPHRKGARDVRNTLVDTEMIIEHVKMDNGQVQEVPRLLIYDIVVFEDQDVGKLDFRKRFECIDFELIKPRTKAFMEGKLRREKEIFSVRRKGFWNVEAIAKLFDQKFLANLGHEIDGLIFQPVHKEYIVGRCPFILKWKPPELCTIDFRLSIAKEVRPGEVPTYVGLLFVDRNTEFARIVPATKTLQKYDGKIVECQFINNKWQVMRERTDKSFPNALSTAQSVANCIRYPIHRDGLIDFVLKHARRQQAHHGAPSQHAHH
ncbi:mRNA capping enzyme domain-containing protein [Aphelenchoides avenae]|nr:mRNA capping enzyme domain-containing protein [Aphelenchus avenae]